MEHQESTEESNLIMVLKDISVNYRDHIMNGCPVILDRFARFIKMSWIHCTKREERDLLVVFIKYLTVPKGLRNNTNPVAKELYEFTKNVFPLKLLTRQCIMKHVTFNDVKHLQLPRALKVYVRLGEISADHPVHCMSKAQLAA